MSRFFESEMVRDTVMDLEKMQQQLAKDMYLIGTYSKEQKQDHLKLLKAFLEKQKLFFSKGSLPSHSKTVSWSVILLRDEYTPRDPKHGSIFLSFSFV